MPPVPPADSRTEALRIITRWLETSEFPDRMISGTGRERAFLTELVYGVIRHRRALEWLAVQCSDRTPTPSTLPAIMLGMQQLLFMNGVPDYAAVNDTVSALKSTTRNRGRVSYVNAILRRVIRERDALLKRLSEQPVTIRESHPGSLVRRWTAAYGADRCEALCHWNNTKPGIVIRPRCTADGFVDYCERLREAAIAFEPHPFAPQTFLAIAHGTRATELPGFAEGAVAIQDPVTAAAVDLLDPQPGEHILDACASPGGKTGLMADRTQDQATIVACDVHADRIALLEDTLRRLRLTDIQIVKADLRKDDLPEALTEAPFDRILLDVPCSNTGVLRRRPDARWRFDPQRLANTVALQHALLDRTAQLVKPGGRLVYSTCSLEPEENQDQVQGWLEENDRFTMEASKTLFPPETQTDGAYAAALVARA
ncbi:MAG: 16S rRNA (cytosine(967)-C(5))-methyltransferase RsmB [Kiritimatiellae bacterium]|nr:16S rRNA (cytosine(967)-C(5))-methyltransferase RsmB [Kiritimatiellia bacterium]